MVEFEWEKKVNRAQAAAMLRELAQSLEGDGAVELEQDGWELKLEASDQIEMEVEVEVGDGEIELEIELKWPARAAQPKQPAKKG